MEAGPDTPPGSTPADILATYPGRAMANLDYFWPQLRVRRGDGAHIPEKAREAAFFHQARVMGGGSSINAQIALRGLPRDFDAWRESGAPGWDWESVLPFFRKLECDRDFDTPCTANTGRFRSGACRARNGIGSPRRSAMYGQNKAMPSSRT